MFDAVDLVDACVATLPDVFGPAKEALLANMLQLEASVQESQALALYSFDARTGRARDKLQTALHVLAGMVPRLGGSEQEAAKLPEAALEQLLRARREEILQIMPRLTDAVASSAAADAEEGDSTAPTLRCHIATLLAAEGVDIARALAARADAGTASTAGAEII